MTLEVEPQEHAIQRVRQQIAVDAVGKKLQHGAPTGEHERIWSHIQAIWGTASDSEEGSEDEEQTRITERLQHVELGIQQDEATFRAHQAENADEDSLSRESLKLLVRHYKRKQLVWTALLQKKNEQLLLVMKREELHVRNLRRKIKELHQQLSSQNEKMRKDGFTMAKLNRDKEDITLLLLQNQQTSLLEGFRQEFQAEPTSEPTTGQSKTSNTLSTLKMRTEYLQAMVDSQRDQLATLKYQMLQASTARANADFSIDKLQTIWGITKRTRADLRRLGNKAREFRKAVPAVLREMQIRIMTRMQWFINKHALELNAQQEDEVQRTTAPKAGYLTPKERTDLVAAVTKKVRSEFKNGVPGQRSRMDVLRQRMWTSLTNTIRKVANEILFYLTPKSDAHPLNESTIEYEDEFTLFESNIDGATTEVNVYRECQVLLRKMGLQLKKLRGSALYFDGSMSGIDGSFMLASLQQLQSELADDEPELQTEMSELLKTGSTLIQEAEKNQWKRNKAYTELKKIKGDMDKLLDENEKSDSLHDIASMGSKALWDKVMGVMRTDEKEPDSGYSMGSFSSRRMKTLDSLANSSILGTLGAHIPRNHKGIPTDINSSEDLPFTAEAIAGLALDAARSVAKEVLQETQSPPASTRSLTGKPVSPFSGILARQQSSMSLISQLDQDGNPTEGRPPMSTSNQSLVPHSDTFQSSETYSQPQTPSASGILDSTAIVAPVVPELFQAATALASSAPPRASSHTKPARSSGIQSVPGNGASPRRRTKGNKEQTNPNSIAELQKFANNVKDYEVSVTTPPSVPRNSHDLIEIATAQPLEVHSLVDILQGVASREVDLRELAQYLSWMVSSGKVQQWSTKGTLTPLRTTTLSSSEGYHRKSTSSQKDVYHQPYHADSELENFATVDTPPQTKPSVVQPTLDTPSKFYSSPQSFSSSKSKKAGIPKQRGAANKILNAEQKQNAVKLRQQIADATHKLRVKEASIDLLMERLAQLNQANEEMQRKDKLVADLRKSVQQKQDEINELKNDRFDSMLEMSSRSSTFIAFEEEMVNNARSASEGGITIGSTPSTNTPNKARPGSATTTDVPTSANVPVPPPARSCIPQRTVTPPMITTTSASIEATPPRGNINASKTLSPTKLPQKHQQQSQQPTQTPQQHATQQQLPDGLSVTGASVANTKQHQMVEAKLSELKELEEKLQEVEKQQADLKDEQATKMATWSNEIIDTKRVQLHKLEESLRHAQQRLSAATQQINKQTHKTAATRQREQTNEFSKMSRQQIISQVLPQTHAEIQQLQHKIETTKHTIEMAEQGKRSGNVSASTTETLLAIMQTAQSELQDIKAVAAGAKQAVDMVGSGYEVLSTHNGYLSSEGVGQTSSADEESNRVDEGNQTHPKAKTKHLLIIDKTDNNYLNPLTHTDIPVTPQAQQRILEAHGQLLLNSITSEDRAEFNVQQTRPDTSSKKTSVSVPPVAIPSNEMVLNMPNYSSPLNSPSTRGANKYPQSTPTIQDSRTLSDLSLSGIKMNGSGVASPPLSPAHRSLSSPISSRSVTFPPTNPRSSVQHVGSPLGWKPIAGRPAETEAEDSVTYHITSMPSNKRTQLNEGTQKIISYGDDTYVPSAMVHHTSPTLASFSIENTFEAMVESSDTPKEMRTVSCQVGSDVSYGTTSVGCQTITAKPHPHRCWCHKCGAGPFIHPCFTCTLCMTPLIYTSSNRRSELMLKVLKLYQVRDLLRTQRQLNNEIAFLETQFVDLEEEKHHVMLQATETTQRSKSISKSARRRTMSIAALYGSPNVVKTNFTSSLANNANKPMYYITTPASPTLAQQPFIGSPTTNALSVHDKVVGHKTGVVVDNTYKDFHTTLPVLRRKLKYSHSVSVMQPMPPPMPLSKGSTITYSSPRKASTVASLKGISLVHEDDGDTEYGMEKSEGAPDEHPITTEVTEPEVYTEQEQKDFDDEETDIAIYGSIDRIMDQARKRAMNRMFEEQKKIIQTTISNGVLNARTPLVGKAEAQLKEPTVRPRGLPSLPPSVDPNADVDPQSRLNTHLWLRPRSSSSPYTNTASVVCPPSQ